MSVHPLAGRPAPRELLVDIPVLMTAYYTGHPDPAVARQRVAFGTSGHRGTSLQTSFNEDHIVAVCRAICEHRGSRGIDGPLYIGKDTHALSEAAMATAVEVFAAHGVELFIQSGGGYTPTPVISHAILTHNRGRASGLADGVVVTPSHNPPEDGGIKYNPPNGGPADGAITRAIQDRANEILAGGLGAVPRMSHQRALAAQTTHLHDYVRPYVDDLAGAVDLAAIRQADLAIGVDPLGGSGIHYWPVIAETHGLRIEVVNATIDPTFGFMHVDRDGRIRMDCSSPYAMAGLIAHKDRFAVSFGNDPDYDRHGIVARSAGLMNPNHYLAVAIEYLFTHRPAWGGGVAVGKTLVSSSMIDRVAAGLGREVVEVPVGFKWFVEGLLSGRFGFAGEESAGASFLRRDGSVWTTDKDGILLGLLAAEITAVTGTDPGEHYRALEGRYGRSCYERIDAPASPAQKAALSGLSAGAIRASELAGEPITACWTHAPGNNSPIGGLKVASENGWFAARPSGTEDVYKIYAESFRGQEHLRRIQDEAREIVGAAIGG